MKKHLGSFISGVLVSALAFGLVGTAAATVGKKTLEVDYKNIAIQVDDKEIIPKDASGNVVEPFAYNGTTYVPLRAVAEALGCNVYYKENAKPSPIAGIRRPYPALSPSYQNSGVPRFEKVAGNATFYNSFPIENGICEYLYVVDKFSDAVKDNYLKTYGELLISEGFKLYADDRNSQFPAMHYVNDKTQAFVSVSAEKDQFFVSVVVNEQGMKTKNETGGAATQKDDSTVDNGGGQVVVGTNPDNSEAPSLYSFPLHLYSNDGKTYLGKLVTSKYDTDGIWNTYGTYGSKYSSTSIWNEYGNYGGKYSSESAFNQYTQTPPKIVDNDGVLIGYLTTNKYLQNSYSVLELTQLLSKNFQ